MTLAQLRAYVRDLTGVYSTDLLPDTLLDRWLQEAYSELNRADEWPWMVNVVSGTIVTGASTITLSNSSGKIKEVTLAFANGVLIQVPSQRSLIQTVDGDDQVMYDCNSSNNIVLSTPMKENATYKVNYVLTAPLIQTSGKATEIPDEYEGIIAYRTAVKVLGSQADDTDRGSFYLSEYASMLEDMKTDLIIDDDLGPIQIGGEILRIDGRTQGRVNLRFRSS